VKQDQTQTQTVNHTIVKPRPTVMSRRTGSISSYQGYSSRNGNDSRRPSAISEATSDDDMKGRTMKPFHRPPPLEYNSDNDDDLEKNHSDGANSNVSQDGSDQSNSEPELNDRNDHLFYEEQLAYRPPRKESLTVINANMMSPFSSQSTVQNLNPFSDDDDSDDSDDSDDDQSAWRRSSNYMASNRMSSQSSLSSAVLIDLPGLSIEERRTHNPVKSPHASPRSSIYPSTIEQRLSYMVSC
jgi:hypothetical protein